MSNPEGQQTQNIPLEMPEHVRVLRDTMLAENPRANVSNFDWSNGQAFADQETIELPVLDQTPQSK